MADSTVAGGARARSRRLYRRVPWYIVLSVAALAVSASRQITQMTNTTREPSQPLFVTTDRPEAVYRRGEPITFRVERNAATDSLPELVPYTVTWDGGPLIERGTVPLADLPASVAVTVQEPGFVRLRIDLDGETPPSQRPQAAAAVEPESIGPSLPVPDDFDAFWQDELRAQNALPVDAEVSLHAEQGTGTIYSVRVTMPAGGDIYGWLLVPRTSARPDGRFAVVVRYHGAGVYRLAPENGLDWTERGVMVFSVNPHPIPNDWPQERYVELRTGALADYRTRGRNDRRTIYFREMFGRAARAVDFVASRPEWDGEHLIVEGHSQGGGQALAAAALNRKVTAIAVSCPTHCDHTGPAIGRVAGWPKIVEVRDGVPDSAQVQAARYYDGVNFASRIGVPAFFSFAFLDDLCCPTGVYAAYNALGGPKSIRYDPNIGHIHTDAAREATYRWVEEYLRGER